MSNTGKILIGVGVVFTILIIADLLWWNNLFGRGQVSYPKDINWAKRQKTLDMVNSMHPKLRQNYADFFTEVEKKLGYVVVGTSGLRTPAQQAALAFSNDKNAESGLSDHEYGFAMDINVADLKGKIFLQKATSKQKWIDSGVVEIGKKFGFKWGGDFKNYHDPIHFYNDFGIPAPEMIERKKAGKVDKEGYLKV